MTCSVTDMLAKDGPIDDTAQTPDRPAAPGGERKRQVDGLFERHGNRLLGYLRGMLRSTHDAEDIAQECYTRLLEVDELKSGEAQARNYLFRIATNLACDRFRARQARGIEIELAENTLSDGGLDPLHIVDFGQCLAIIRQTILDLRPRSRRVFLMRVSEQLSYEEIASTLSISTRTAEREMRHAIDLCQKRLRSEQRQ